MVAPLCFSDVLLLDLKMAAYALVHNKLNSFITKKNRIIHVKVIFLKFRCINELTTLNLNDLKKHKFMVPTYE